MLRCFTTLITLVIICVQFKYDCEKSNNITNSTLTLANKIAYINLYFYYNDISFILVKK